jgi:hypothetical protein
MRKHSFLSFFVLLVVLALVLTACNGEETNATETTEAVEPTQAPTEPMDEPHPDTPIGDFEEVLISTTATNVVGVGSYVAAEPYAVPAGDDPAEEPLQAFIMPYGIYPNMHVTDISEFDYMAQSYRIIVEGFTFAWALTAPDGSSAELLDPYLGLFLADVAGEYVLTLTATDEAGNAGEVSWTITAATYVGVGGEGAAPPQCSACHSDETEGWAATGHSDILTRGLEGTLSSHYGPNCISCHTTGFNNRPEAVNGGFDDLMAEFGWDFPGTLGEGLFETFASEYPEVAVLANIQCEACHGPGSAHSGGGPVGTSLSYGVCASCHAEEPYHTFPQQWELSSHAEATARAFWYPTGEGREDCARCHSGVGFIDFAAGVPEEERRTDYQVITCAVCHDPHDASSPTQLRIFDTVEIASGDKIINGGASATCMSCHNQNGNASAEVAGAAAGERFHTPHYSAAAELSLGTGGYTWGEELPASNHASMGVTCISCHMAESPGMDDAGTPDDSSDDSPLPGHMTVGGHTFSMVSPVDGTENVGACTSCHADATTFDFTAKGDYDGDGTVEGNKAEIEGLYTLIKAELEAAGVVFLGRYPYFEYPDGAGEDIYGAVWNYQLLTHNNIPAHNLKYLVALGQLTYEKLTGEPVPGADLVE